MCLNQVRIVSKSTTDTVVGTDEIRYCSKNINDCDVTSDTLAKHVGKFCTICSNLPGIGVCTLPKHALNALVQRTPKLASDSHATVPTRIRVLGSTSGACQSKCYCRTQESKGLGSLFFDMAHKIIGVERSEYCPRRIPNVIDTPWGAYLQGIRFRVDRLVCFAVT